MTDMIGDMGLRQFKKAATRSKNQQVRIELLKERRQQKYPQKVSAGTIPSKGDLALSVPIQTTVTTGVFDRLNESADRAGLSRAEWLRQAIDCYLAACNSEVPSLDAEIM